MQENGIKNTTVGLDAAGIKNVTICNWNLTPQQLMDKAISLGQGVYADNGAIVFDSGEFSGRSPKDRFIVRDNITENDVNWGDTNVGVTAEAFDRLQAEVCAHYEGKEIYVRDNFVCANPNYRLNVRTINAIPYHNLFVDNMFMRPSDAEKATMVPDWTILCAPDYKTKNIAENGLRQGNFVIVNFTKKMVLIAGTGYAGEMKKSIFSVLNFILPVNRNVLPMHCSANIGKDNDTAVFFGLSGTGKTTLSADPNRALIGDDEHGWADDGVFNFEGGCYAKCVDLTAEKEPEIWAAIKHGTVLENVKFIPGTTTPDYANISKTENTRAAYPMTHIANAVNPSVGSVPKNIFFLTCDAFGVLPPISKLTPGQAMYHFISGYTAKVAGTEAGITEPSTTFSACFGAPFLPLHPTRYAEMLGERMRKTGANVWLVNTGWSGGAYGTGSRMKLKFTRAMITAALNGQLANVQFENHPIFGLAMPTTCPDVPTEILNPRNTWADGNAYDAKANDLANKFVNNFSKYASQANEEIMSAAPKMMA
ncbi:MAG: phosphoenolpyruvate carboxykinase [Bacteroidota bacterium]